MRALASLPVPSSYEPPALIDVPSCDAIPIADQGNMGRCTGEATKRVAEAVIHRKTGQVLPLSALFGYNMTRIEEGTPLSEDSGCQIVDAIAGFVRRGLATEAVFPSRSDGLELVPSDAAKADTLKHEGLIYYHAPDLLTILAALAQGFPV